MTSREIQTSCIFPCTTTTDAKISDNPEAHAVVEPVKFVVHQKATMLLISVDLARHHVSGDALARKTRYTFTR